MKRTATAIPESRTWLVDGFCRYTRRMVAKRFTALGVQGVSGLKPTVSDDRAVVVYANHVGWWDPIVAMLLRKAYMPQKILYAPIDARALESYRIFSKMGFFGIQLERLQGAADFLATSRAILARPQSSLWITPEGTFADCRDHSKPLMPGLAHLAASSPEVAFVPLAMEYPFWEEAKPMVLVRFGAPTCFSGGVSKSECAQHLDAALRETQRALAEAVIARQSDAFEFLIAPRASRTSWYDSIRAWKAWFRGRSFDPSHASVTRQSRR